MGTTREGRFRAGLAVGLVLAAFAGGLASGHLGLAGAQGGSGDPVFVALTAPVRYLDTRAAPFGPIGVDAAVPVGSAATIDVPIAGALINGTAHVPLTARSVLVNITAVNATAETFVTAFSTDAARPNASTLNPAPGRTTFNTATVAQGPSHRMRLYNDAGRVDLIVDVVGYYVDHDHDDRYYTEVEIDALLPTVQTVVLSGAAFPGTESPGGCVEMDYHMQDASLPVPPGATVLSVSALLSSGGIYPGRQTVTLYSTVGGSGFLDRSDVATISALSASGWVDAPMAAPFLVPDRGALTVEANAVFEHGENAVFQPSAFKVCAVEVTYSFLG